MHGAPLAVLLHVGRDGVKEPVAKLVVVEDGSGCLKVAFLVAPSGKERIAGKVDQGLTTDG